MSFSFRKFSVATAAVAALCTPAFAQEMAKEVLQEYADQMASNGMMVTPGSVTESGSTIEWKDVVVGLPDDAGSYTLAFIRAEDQGDGSAKLSYPEEVTMKIDPKGEQPTMDVVVRSSGVSHIVSGPKGARVHDISADTLGVVVSSASPAFSMVFDLSDMVSNQVVTDGDVINYAGDIKIADAKMTYSIDDQNMKMSSVGGYTNLAATYNLDSVTKDNLDQLFNGTRNFSIAYTMGSGVGTSDITNPDMAMVIESAAGSGSGTFSVQQGVFSMEGVGNDASYTVTLKDLPMPPFSASMDQATTAIVMPLKKAEAPQGARIQMGFDGLKASDTVWGMVDPTGSLPRDAARLNIDLTAQLKWLTDLMKVQEADGMPAEVSEVTINDITLEIAGASFSGKGAAMLDNSKFPPEPVGEINMDLKGGIGLLDKLVALGLVPQQQGQMVKMMSGMFAVPGGNGTDHLTSKIEMKKGGSILANGQRIK